MMKTERLVCVKLANGAIDRIFHSEATKLVKEGKAKFVPKRVWRTMRAA